MREALIVSTARTPIGKAYRGAFNATSAQTLIGHAVSNAVSRAGLDGSEVEDCIVGCAIQQGSTGGNVGRQAVIRAGLPVTVAGMSLDRQCSSGMMAIATAAKQVITDGMDIAIGGGVESISLVQNEKMRVDHLADAWIKEHKPALYMTMLETAETVAERYGVSREDQDAYALQSQQRTAAAQEAGKFDDEIVGYTVKTRKGDTLVDKDEYIRHGATLEAMQKLRPAFSRDGTVTAGNASGLNDGAAAVLVMTEDEASRRGLTPLARIASYATAGVDPAIMGSGPIPASRKALEKAGWKIEDLDLVEANEAFAAQACAVNKDLGWNPEIVNVNGGAIAIGHPVGASGARVLTTLLYEMGKRDAKKGLATLCIGGGMGIAMCVERD